MTDYSDPERYKHLSSGAVYDLQLKRIVSMDPDKNPWAITKSNAKDFQLRRNEISRQVAREAIDEGAGLDPSQWGTGEGWRAVIVHTVQQYLKSSNIRGMGEVFQKLGTAGGYLASEKDEREIKHTHYLETEELRELMKLLQEAIPQAVEGKVIDG